MKTYFEAFLRDRGIPETQNPRLRLVGTSVVVIAGLSLFGASARAGLDSPQILDRTDLMARDQTPIREGFDSVPCEQIPSMVDELEEVSNLADMAEFWAPGSKLALNYLTFKIRSDLDQRRKECISRDLRP